jgi:hypothetical protein
MSKTAKKAKKRVTRPKSYMMVIRVSVPAKLVPRLKVRNVVGMYDRDRFCTLEILNAYYDKTGQPDAMPDPQ